ncbi:MAG TPA: hypothetical protein VMV41_13795, partial [Cellulomonadaceae bacterium]|nr:hypothetical protein [Cellulomonadaceae bacterium]
QALVRIEELITRISESQATVSSAIEEQSAVTAEIARAIGTIADGTRDTSNQTSKVLSAMNAVQEQTSRLHDMIRNG